MSKYGVCDIIAVSYIDGLLDGYSCNGPGRRTVWSYDANGNLIKKGIDLNRSFPCGYTLHTDSRNYNGPRALSSPEARALDTFLKDVAKKAQYALFGGRARLV